MKKDTFIGNRKQAVVETTRLMSNWSTKVTLVKSSRKRISERVVYPNTRKEGLSLARAFVR